MRRNRTRVKATQHLEILDAASERFNPEQMVGKFCAALLDNDVNGDGRVDGKDIGYDLLFYNYDSELFSHCLLDCQ